MVLLYHRHFCVLRQHHVNKSRVPPLTPGRDRWPKGFSGLQPGAWRASTAKTLSAPNGTGPEFIIFQFRPQHCLYLRPDPHGQVSFRPGRGAALCGIPGKLAETVPAKGTLSAQSLVFLKTALAEGNDTPTLLSLHHPPFRSGINFMDDIGLINRAAFRDVVSDHTGPLRIIGGHIHSMMVTDVGGHIAISAPSPCSTFAYDRRPDAPVGFMTLEDGCLLHTWDGGFQTIRIGPVAGPGPFPF